ncbi:hypothetical protein MKW94_030472 [Papaver nudicaule]|uniref:Gnk2-homologous domain-containing protein n=1 Tax=Papaver nudicaule TaxID=74823 RepID=A0AA41UT79_PAPNU|nr:hypothetical protein [Papaver nudicaule]
MWNLNNVSDANVVNKKTRELITSLSEKAIGAGMKLFATGEMALGGYSDEKLYGLVQCSRDLSSRDCKKCLDEAVSELVMVKEVAELLVEAAIVPFCQGLRHNMRADHLP